MLGSPGVARRVRLGALSLVVCALVVAPGGATAAVGTHHVNADRDAIGRVDGVPTVATVGTAKMLVILVRWGSVPLATDQATAQDFVFGTDPRSVDQWYREVSYGLFHWSGDVTPVLTVPDPGTDCHTVGDFGYYFALAAAADAAANAAGYDAGAYPIRFIDFPDTGCAYHSLSQVGGPYVWSDDALANLGDTLQRFAAVHELGHALGLTHSNGRDCGTEVATVECLADDSTVASYVYAWDAMGTNAAGNVSGAVGWFSAEHLRALGWFGTLAGPRWVSPTTSGVFSLAPIEVQSTTLPQALVIDTPTREYWIEVRAPIGQDAYLSGWPQATAGVLVSLRGAISGSGADRDPELLDMTPDSDLSSQRADFFDAALVPGESFTDVDGTFALTVGRVSHQRARVAVAFDGVDDDAPFVVAPPTPALRAGRLGAKGAPVTVSWRAADPVGVCRYTVQESLNGASFSTLALSSPVAESLAQRMPIGSTARYRVRAVDCAGNASPWVRGPRLTAAVLQEDSPSIGYSGQWTHEALVGASGGSVTATTDVGAQASASVTASSAGVVVVRGPGRGTIDLSADGVDAGTLSLEADRLTTRSVVSVFGWPSVGPHTMALVVAPSGGSVVELDAIVVLVPAVS